MWIAKDRNHIRDKVFRELMLEIIQMGRVLRLSPGLRQRLNMFSKAERSEIVNRVREGNTPLFVAVRNGALDVIKFLVEECGAHVEKKGVYEVNYEASSHYVTPLWCAAVVGNIEVCKLLISYGADVNSTSDTGSTAVRSACYMSHVEVVKYLVENGADVNKPNTNGGTCLINAVQSVELCEFLLASGADIDCIDSQQKTALHYAAQEDRLETTKLLLSRGADWKQKSKHGDDILQSACILGNSRIVDYLVKTLDYTPERIIGAYELLGATAFDERRTTRDALDCWRTAVRLREEHGIPQITVKPNPAFLNRQPFDSQDFLNRIAFNVDEIRIQSLMVNERVLGQQHKDNLFRLMFRGAAYADSQQQQRCIDIWMYALDIRLASNDILVPDTCNNVVSLIKIMFDLFTNNQASRVPHQLELKTVFRIIEIFLEYGPKTMQSLQKETYNKKQAHGWDKLMRLMPFCVNLAEQVITTAEERAHLEKLVRRLVRLWPKSYEKNTLLHIAVGQIDQLSDMTQINSLYSVLPSVNFCRMLLDAGAPIEEVNRDGSTPLHFASLRVNYDENIVRMLLDAGAHLDRTNEQGNQPYRMLGGNPECKIALTKYINLKCLAASKVKSYKIDYTDQITTALEEFIKLH